MKRYSLRSLGQLTRLSTLLGDIESYAASLGHKVDGFQSKSSRLLSHLYNDTVDILSRLRPIVVEMESQRGGGPMSRERLVANRIDALDSRHNMVIEAIADLKRSESVGIGGADTVDNILRGQLLLSTLLQHAYHLTSKRHFCETGSVQFNADVMSILGAARAQAYNVAEHNFASSLPEMRLNEYNDNVPIALTCVPAHVNFVFQEVFKNALHATLRQGATTTTSVVPWIDVEVEQTPTAVRIATKDQGVGMCPEMVQRATQFLSNATSDPVALTESQASYQPMSAPLSGLGAGLALSKIYCEIFGGAVRVASEGEGKGAQVIVEFSLDEDRLWEPPS